MGVIMNDYSKLILLINVMSLHLFASDNQSIEIKKLEAQALAKLTNQLHAKTKIDVSPELERLDEIALEQDQKRADSLQSATTICGAATIGALLAKATQSSLSNIRTPYKTVIDDAITSTAEETSRFITGLEIPALVSMIPSTQTLLYGSLALGGLFTLYELHRAIHAPCRAKFTLAENKWGTQLRLIREYTEKTDAQNAKTETEHKKALALVQQENSRLNTLLLDIQTHISQVRQNQQHQRAQVNNLGTAISGIQNSLTSMSKQAHWDLDRSRQRVTTAHEPQAAHVVDASAGTCCFGWQTTTKPKELR